MRLSYIRFIFLIEQDEVICAGYNICLKSSATRHHGKSCERSDKQASSQDIEVSCYAFNH